MTEWACLGRRWGGGHRRCVAADNALLTCEVAKSVV